MEGQPQKPKRFVGLKNKNSEGQVSTTKGDPNSSVETNNKNNINSTQANNNNNNSQAVVVTKSRNTKVINRKVNTIPSHITENAELREMASLLPQNYNFEIYKTIWRIQEKHARKVALQFPEGLLVYSCLISDIIERFCEVSTVIMGDVTYGACCVDDYSAFALGCDFLVHYAHSCLIPIDQCKVNTMYVFVDIKFDVGHCVETIKANFAKDTKICLVGTIQFTSALPAIKTVLKDTFPDIVIPQERPLSPGEILGCTSPKIGGERDILLYIGDGRFHLESAMISNPNIKAYKYDPYSKKLTTEQYGHEEMHKLRKQAISAAKEAKHFGVILGTLGRQGRPRILARLEGLCREKGIECSVFLLSEIFPSKLALFPQIEAWVQIACPRLSIDWGYAFTKPILNPYEAEVALDAVQWKEVYPMDYYSKSGGSWTNYFVDK